MNTVSKKIAIKNINNSSVQDLIDRVEVVKHTFLNEGFAPGEIKVSFTNDEIKVMAYRPATPTEKAQQEESERQNTIKAIEELRKKYPYIIKDKKAALAVYEKNTLVFEEQSVKLQNMKKRIAEYQETYDQFQKEIIEIDKLPLSEIKAVFKKYNEFVGK